MKKIILVFSIILTVNFTLKAQTPQGFNYQAVARNNAGVALINQSIGLQISLRQGTANGTAVYTETHTVTSNNIGLINLVVGSGTVVTGTFNTINWATGPYFIEISMDVTGGTTYSLMGTQQLMSVPYALYAANGGTQGSPGNTGATGVSGLVGATGMMGDIGSTGDTGAMGFTGTTGDIGATGVTGSIGVTGGIGATGDMGNSGATGSTGSIGVTGATGSGSTGSTGPIGDRYATTSTTSMDIVPVSSQISFTVESGLAYSIGQDVIIAFSSTEQMNGTITNYNSSTGVMDVTVAVSIGSGTALQPWAVNLKGAPGPAGPIGQIGSTGTTGAAGIVGTTGTTGSIGNVGTTGAIGTTGDMGATGTTGVMGATGAIGSTGATGAVGITGNMGATGTTGSMGATGGTGTMGATGSIGSTGSTGLVGATGADAVPFAIQFNIVNNGASSYLFDNASDYVSSANSNPTITLYRGFTYKFNINASCHPFRIASTQGGGQFNVGVSSNDVQSGIITFKVPQNAPSQLFYYCVFHPGSMFGTINIQ
jgi:hypothetical protein